MLSISEPLQAGAAEYYVNYYQKHSKGEGVWFGKAAAKLSLRGDVKREDLLSLMLGFHPRSDAPLVQNAGKPDRQAAWDLTFSAPKALSVLWSVLPEKERATIERAQTEAVKETLKTLENVAGVTRRGKAGGKIEKADLVFALFNDYTSRNLDAQVHTHVLLFNLCVRSDGSTGSLRSKDFFEIKMELGELYRTSLAEKLSSLSALIIEPDTVGFRIKGVPETLCSTHSTRRDEIRGELSKIGAFDAVSAKKATLKTRKTAKNASLDALFEKWKRVGEEHSFGPKEALSAFYRERKQSRTVSPPLECPKHSRSTKESSKQQEKGQDGEHKTPSYESGKDRVISTLKFFGGHFAHIRTQKFALPVDPLRSNGSFWRKKALKAPYIALGPRQQRWGLIQKRIFTLPRMGELRVQERILFPRTPFVQKFCDWRLPAVRWVSYKTIEADYEWANRRGLRVDSETESLWSYLGFAGTKNRTTNREKRSDHGKRAEEKRREEEDRQKERNNFQSR